MSEPMPPDPVAQAAAIEDLDERRLLVLRLGEVAHRFGCSSPRVEELMAVVAERVGQPGQFFDQPTSLLAAFGRAPLQTTVLLRFEPGSVDLGKRWHIDATVEALLDGRLSSRQALSELERIEGEPPRYAPLTTLVCGAVASAATASFFGSSPADLAAAALCGLVVGLLALAAERSRKVERLQHIASAAVVALLAVLISAWITPLSTYTVTVSGLIWLLPGLTLATSVSEIALRHLSAGTARLMLSLFTFLELGFGAALGRVTGTLLTQLDAAAPAQAPMSSPWALALALCAFPIAFTVLLRARPQDVGWIAAATSLAFAGSRWGSVAIGPALGAFVGALLVGLGSNLYSRQFERPSAVPMLPGILMLVPGSLGFRSLSALIERDVLSGIGTAFTVWLVVLSIVTGLFVAGALLPPRRLDSPGA
jgi:uncharacterized membrane protein YjjP (DUF1212 family)